MNRVSGRRGRPGRVRRDRLVPRRRPGGDPAVRYLIRALPHGEHLPQATGRTGDPLTWHEGRCVCHPDQPAVHGLPDAIRRVMLDRHAPAPRKPKIRRTVDGLWERDGVTYTTWEAALRSVVSTR